MESLGDKMVLLPMIVLPVMVCVVIPAVMIILALQSGVYMVSGSELIERIFPLYSIPSRFAASAEKLLYVFLNFMLMPIFYIIPIMSSAVLAANSVAGEKERRSLETLLYSPLSNREFVLGKLLSAFIPSMAISLGAFALYFSVSNGIFLAMRGTIVIDSPSWIPAILLLTPAASILGLGCSLLASIKAKSYVEAQQASAVAILPCILFIAAQIGGIVVIGPLGVAGAAIVLFGIDYLLIMKAAPRFERERIIDCL
jgi:ABC-type Na+ efflux pump permease subunit